jgi:hypothetical protein
MKTVRLFDLRGWASASVLLVLCLAGTIRLPNGAPQAAAQQGPTPRKTLYPPLFFREDWKLGTGVPNTFTTEEPEHPVFQGDVANPNLEVHVYGEKVGPRIADQTYNDNITYVMTLLCTTNCAVTLRDKNNDVDLTGLASIRWRTRISGFHFLHPILKLADGTWLIGDKAASFSTDWVVSEMEIVDVHWKKLDIENVVEASDGRWVNNPDLSKVSEIGFTDLMRGGGHGAGGGSRVDWIEVYGKPVPRSGSDVSNSAGR